MEKANPASQPAHKAGTQYCCVVQCHNSLENTKDRYPPVKFYRFPGKWYEAERRKAWKAAVRRVNPDNTPWEPNQTSRICSDHFVGNCKSDLSLHPSYIPTIFPPVYQNNSANLVTVKGRQKHLVDQQCFGLSESKEAATERTLADSGNEGLEMHQCLDTAHLYTCPPALPEQAGVSIKTEPVDLETSSCTLMQVLGPAAFDVSCQTECSPVGELSVLLSATDGATASTQVTHAQQLDKLPLFAGVPLCSI
ncbi:uncharacterized protein LOC119386753 isoform X2 [Rhipicephalus sanguineus]|uniref:uncharacterized protein LOC119386753 isoform X2 n=1 Tax=Rhipicephalus sanguineus TaxID=34632 RepID=UPI001895B9BF|nr:uncharacterized protein LOC119386753 isoform X2 [Rhipicephalus sanguineus]